MDNKFSDLFANFFSLVVPPEVVLLSPDQREVAVSEGGVTLSFIIRNAIPDVMTSDMRWYYAANAPAGPPDFTSADFEDITDLLNRTTFSSLNFTSDMLTLNIDNIVQAIGDVAETDQGRYILSATNPAGERSNHIDVIVRGNSTSVVRLYFYFLNGNFGSVRILQG